MRHRIVVLGAVVVAALGPSACSSHQPVAEVDTPPPPTTSQPAAAPQPTGLPAPEALTDVLYRLADPAIPGEQKLDLVAGATAAHADTLDRFANALRDNGYTPPTLAASDIGWADADPADVVATIAVRKPDDPGDSGAGFSIPMQFKPYHGGWQLSQDTFDMLLTFKPPPAPPR